VLGRAVNSQRAARLRGRGIKPRPWQGGLDELSLRKGHTYRIVVSDLVRDRPIWFGGTDRSEASLHLFFEWLGPKKSRKIRLVAMDMWKPFRNACSTYVPNAAILYDKFHAMRHLNEALDKVRRSEYARLSGADRKFIKGQRYTLLSHRENLTLDGKRALRTLLKANQRLHTAYLLKESLASSGTIVAKPGHGSSSRTGVLPWRVNDSTPARSSPR